LILSWAIGLVTLFTAFFFDYQLIIVTTVLSMLVISFQIFSLKTEVVAQLGLDVFNGTFKFTALSLIKNQRNRFLSFEFFN
jgi:hypothetical protein